MTSRKSSFLTRTSFALAAAGILMLVAGCGGKDQSGQMPPAQVGVMVLQPQEVPLVNSATGRLSAYRSADVRARASGVLLKRTYKEGTHVEKGQQLFQIDPAPLKAALSAAEADLAKSRATYANSHVAAERARRLIDKGYVSKSDLDDAEAAERTANAAVQAAKSQVEDAKITLGYASVSSPIAGRAGKQQVTEGALVGQGSATLLTTVRQIDPLYVNFSMPVDQILQMRASQASGKASLSETDKAVVHLELSGGNEYEHTGTMDFAGMSVDPSTGAVTLRALVPNPDHVLLPGMYTSLQVNMGTLNNAYLIPQSVVLRDADSAYVMVVDKDNKVARKNITTAGMSKGDWIVTDGVDAGDHVIISGLPKVKVGAEVKPSIESKAKAKANQGAGKPDSDAAPSNASSSASPEGDSPSADQAPKS